MFITSLEVRHLARSESYEPDETPDHIFLLHVVPQIGVESSPEKVFLSTLN